MLDRLAVLAPTWTETHAADLGIALVEVAGLRRRSPQLPAGRGQHRGLSRHRAQPHLAAPARPAGRLPDRRRLQRPHAGLHRHRQRRQASPLPAGHAVLRARSRPAAGRARPAAPLAQQLAAGTQPVFASMQSATLSPRAQQHRLLHLGRHRLLPAGRCHRGDAGRHAHRRSQPGDVLIFEEVLGPLTGAARGRRPRASLRRVAHQRHHHRLPGPPARRPARPARSRSRDHLGRRRRAAVPALHLLDHRRRARLPAGSGVSVARGNIVPADHGVWIAAGGARHGAGGSARAGSERRLQLRTAAPAAAPLPALLSRPRPVAADLQRALRPRAGLGAPRSCAPEQRRRQPQISP